MSEIKPYCIVGFGPSEAYLVQAKEAKAVNVSTGFIIDPKELRLNYVDLKQEARLELQRRRKCLDPSILFDSTITITQVLDMYPYLTEYRDDRSVKKGLEIVRRISKDRPDYLSGAIDRYNHNKSLSDDELYNTIIAELNLKVPYEPKPVNGIGSRLWIDYGGFVLCTIELPNLDSALFTLYTTWNTIKEDAEKSMIFRDVCRGQSSQFEQVRQWLRDVAE